MKEPSHVPEAQPSRYIIDPLAARRQGLATVFATHRAAVERIHVLESDEWRRRVG